jgi:WD40 repeat protein
MYCNYCGTANPDEGAFCRKCGKRKHSPTSQSSSSGGVDVSSVKSESVVAAQDACTEEAVSPSIAAHSSSDPVELIPSTHVMSAEPALPKARTSRKFAMVAAAGVTACALLLLGIWISRNHATQVRTLDPDGGNISSVAFSSDGRLLATAASFHTIKLWDVASGTYLRTLSGDPATNWVAFSPDGHLMAASGGAWGSGVQEAALWDVTSGNMVRVLAHARSVGPVTFSPDGRLIASTIDAIADSEAALKMWDVASGNEVRTLPGYAGPVVFSPDGKLLAIANNESIKLLDVSTGNTLRTLPARMSLGGDPSFTFSPDSHMLAATPVLNERGESTMRLWDVDSGKELRIFAVSARGVAFSPDNHLLASGDEDNTIKLWDLSSGRLLRTLAGHKDPVNCVMFSPDGRVLASGSVDGTAKLWAIELRGLTDR